MHTSFLCAHGPEYAKVNNNSNGHNGNSDNIECNLAANENSVDLLCTENIASDHIFGTADYYDNDGNNEIVNGKIPVNDNPMAGTSKAGGANSAAAIDYANTTLNGTFQRNTFVHVNTAGIDPIFLEDRCLDNLLKSEEKWTEMNSYFKTVQKEITPEMRRIVVEWMMEVCEEQKCQEEVVLLALNYMDRFLAAILVGKTHLQILATSCLLLASKLREPSCRGLSADLLVLYTDNSIVKRDLLNWELYVLSKLKWDLSCVTPLDFLELLLSRLPITSKTCPDISREKVRQHSQAFIWLTAKEHCFSVYSASTIAASSIAAALSGLNWHLRTGIGLEQLLNRLTDLIGVEQEYLRECMNKMEYVFREHSRNILSFSVSTPTTNNTTVDNQQKLASNKNNNTTTANNNNNNNSYKMLPSVTSSSLSSSPASSTASSPAASLSGNELDNYKREAGTPTDVQDVKF